jgi:hypothetical protein
MHTLTSQGNHQVLTYLLNLKTVNFNRRYLNNIGIKILFLLEEK